MISFYPIFASSILVLERRKVCQKKLQILLKLAWSVPYHRCAKVVGFLKEFLFFKEFIAKHKTANQDFTRNRKLPFYLLIYFLQKLIIGSYQSELDRFFQTMSRSNIAKRFVSKALLTKVRMKIKPEAFVELNDHLINCFDANFKPISWHGFRLVETDGSTVKLPKTNEIIDHFDVWNVRYGDH
jgi:hypothetical protein